jgi:hypothetical protein
MNSVIEQQIQDREFDGLCSNDSSTIKSVDCDISLDRMLYSYPEVIEFYTSHDILSTLATHDGYKEFKLAGVGPYIVDHVDRSDSDRVLITAHKKIG